MGYHDDVSDCYTFSKAWFEAVAEKAEEKASLPNLLQEWKAEYEQLRVVASTLAEMKERSEAKSNKKAYCTYCNYPGTCAAQIQEGPRWCCGFEGEDPCRFVKPISMHENPPCCCEPPCATVDEKQYYCTYGGSCGDKVGPGPRWLCRFTDKHPCHHAKPVEPSPLYGHKVTYRCDNCGWTLIVEGLSINGISCKCRARRWTQVI